MGLGLENSGQRRLWGYQRDLTAPQYAAPATQFLSSLSPSFYFLLTVSVSLCDSFGSFRLVHSTARIAEAS